MKKVILTIGLLILLVAMANAQPGGHGQGSCSDRPSGMHQKGDRGGPGHKGLGIKRLLAAADEIGLSDAQVDKLKKFSVDFEMEKIDRKADLQKAQVEMKFLMHEQDDAREADVMAAIDNMAELKADLHKMRYLHRQTIRSVLTEEQREKLKELRKNRFEKNKSRFDRGHRKFGG